MEDSKARKSKMPQIGEAVFSIIYLVFGFISGVIMLASSSGRYVIYLYGLMTLILAGGDSFHLVPRIINALKDKFAKYDFWAGLGLFVSSITMTVFYLVLYQVWYVMNPNTGISSAVVYLLYSFAFLRILLCFAPNNKWTSGGNLRWGIIRNVPFIVVGIIMVILFAMVGNFAMVAAIIISFACYIPVVLWAKKNPKIGMLMMPKTMAYMWIIIMGLMLI
ncbi:MAG: hypothetical protein MJ093_02390 [Saccharofermentans sp.]|nr:hypothetical protein [Saccharofermentans sp.]